MSSVGELFVDIRANMAKLAKDIETGSEKAGEAAGDKAGGGFAAKFGKVAGMVGLGLSVGGAVMTGFSTAMNNETAAIKFSTLFHGETEKAKGFIADLQGFAAKTPFDFPTLQDAAGRFLAVGVEAQRVIPIMTTLGDATAMMGTGAEGVDRATTALAQMQQKGKVTGEEMMQLTEAGIPAWDSLAASMGMTVPEVQKLTSKGLVPADAMFTALETTSGKALQSMSGGMSQMATTFEGQWSTLKDTAEQTLGTLFAPLLNAGTVVLGWINATLIPTLQKVPEFFTKWKTPITVVASLLGVVLAPAFATMAISAVAAGVSVVASWVAQAAAAVTAGAQSLLVMTRFALQYVAMGVAALAGAAQVVLAWLMQKAPMVATMAMYVVNFAIMVAGWAASAIAAMASAVVIAAAWLIALGPVGLIIAAVVAIVAIFVLLWNKVEGFRDFWIAVWETVKSIFSTVVDAIVGAVKWLWEMFQKYLDLVWTVWSTIFTTIWNFIKAVWDKVTGWIKTGIDLIVGWISGIWNTVKTTFNSIWTTIKGVWDTVTGWIDTGIKKVVGWIEGIWDTVVTTFNSIKTTITGVWDSITSALSTAITTVINFFKDLPGDIVSAIGNLGSTLYNKGKDLVQGLLNGIKSLGSTIGTFFLDLLPGWIKGPFKKALGIGSPSKVFAGYGRNVVEGLRGGIEDERSGLLADMSNLVPTSSLNWTGEMTGVGGPTSVSVYIGDEPLVARMYQVQEATAADTAGRLVGAGF